MSSPQLRYQHRAAAAGLCVTCGTAPAEPGHARCETCHGGPYRNTRLRYDWAGVDWAMTDHAIARQIGCTARAVGYQRRQAGQAPHRPGRPRKKRVIAQNLQSGVDAPARPA